MKIWFPINLSQSEKSNSSEYMMYCSICLPQLKYMLKRNILFPKWKVLEQKLIESKALDIVSERFNIMNIPNQFINSLCCKYDNFSEKCYYDVSDMIKCYGTTNSLKDIIRLCEYGNDSIPPLNWIRHSYIEFSDMITESAEK